MVTYWNFTFEGKLIYELLSPKKVPQGLIREYLKLKGKPESDEEEYGVIKGYDFKDIIPLTTLANAFCSMTGNIPVPSLPSRRKKMNIDFERPKYCEQMAANSFYLLKSKLDNEFFVEQIIFNGEYYGIIKKKCFGKMLHQGEFFNSQKLALNSNVKGNDATDRLFSFQEGELESIVEKYNLDIEEVRNEYHIINNEKVLLGKYDDLTLMKIFHMRKDDVLFSKIMNFISEILGMDCMKLDHCERYKRIAIERMTNPSVKKKIDEFVASIEEEWSSKKNGKGLKCFAAWMYAIFNYGTYKLTSNISVHEDGRCQIEIAKVNTKGADHRKITVLGEVIVKLDDRYLDGITTEGLYQKFLENKRYSTFLEGGILKFEKKSKYPPYPDFESFFTQIKPKKQLEINIPQ